MIQSKEKDFVTLAFDCMEPLYSTALRLTGSTTNAEDLVHRTYNLAHNIFYTFNRKTNFEGWIIDICRKISDADHKHHANNYHF